MVAAGCETTIIGHCEERNDKAGILAEAGVTDTDAVNRILNQEIKCAIARGMKVLYCIGEKSEEQEQWQEVLGRQLEIGLKDVDVYKRQAERWTFAVFFCKNGSPSLVNASL